MRNSFFYIAFCCILVSSCREDSGNSPASDSQLSRVEEQNQKLLRTNDSLLTVIGQIQRGESSTSAFPATQTAFSTLERYGLPQTDTGLATYLQENQIQLLPGEGILGGTMRFYKARPLEGNFVFAYFEDGHIGGYTLLRYNPKADGSLNWERVYHTPLDQ